MPGTPAPRDLLCARLARNVVRGLLVPLLVLAMPSRPHPHRVIRRLVMPLENRVLLLWQARHLAGRQTPTARRDTV
jgi:hypothetical protein